MRPALLKLASELVTPPDHRKLIAVDDISILQGMLVMRLWWCGRVKKVAHVVPGIPE